MSERFNQQIAFIREVDKLKKIERRCVLTDGSRLENTAEHSWHFALMVPILAEVAEEKIDIAKTTRMALIHDIVEIDAGDTFCYDVKGHEDKDEREIAAANRIFGLLPEDQRKMFRGLWEEFEEGKTKEAKFARAMDRLNPLMLNFYCGGGPWVENKIRKTQVLGRMGEIKTNVPKLWPYVESLITAAVNNNWIIDDTQEP